ncbi:MULTISPECIES: amino acid ABC transporter permease [unclassified Mesorhizobium]|uniref:amino acid ABC transporter permease n=1 Tax=unclassified Mesorhizobium TaxID=325217 RepID=UPI000FCA65FF|nr:MULTISPECIES: amino acid ABC transporter permease [unclassified Mesorhizobium]RUX89351.1 amino acid ABC transporter permease [Mesorhizobium sp. M7D.F.Ca.US.004.01.2.1]RVA18127.1 amino acid ABC transporter permease [Mesorhizobium sp. M7D.F.Ca.US.004.03.1.1]
MNYSLQFGQVIGFLPYLLEGALVSFWLALLAFSGGLLIGLAGAFGKIFGGRVVSGAVSAYCIFLTNTPLLVQIFFIFYGLADFGLLLTPFQAVLIGIMLNTGAYLTEILRAGFLSTRRSELEAAEVLGMSRLQTVHHVIVPHIARVLFPPLSNQYILVVMSTSMGAIFGLEELTGRAVNINAQTFRSIEIFTMTGLIYLGVTTLATALLVLAGRHLLRVRMSVL